MDIQKYSTRHAAAQMVLFHGGKWLCLMPCKRVLSRQVYCRTSYFTQPLGIPTLSLPREWLNLLKTQTPRSWLSLDALIWLKSWSRTIKWVANVWYSRLNLTELSQDPMSSWTKQRLRKLQKRPSSPKMESLRKSTFWCWAQASRHNKECLETLKVSKRYWNAFHHELLALTWIHKKKSLVIRGNRSLSFGRRSCLNSTNPPSLMAFPISLCCWAQLLF